jgi:hypothetical protein
MNYVSSFIAAKRTVMLDKINNFSNTVWQNSKGDCFYQLSFVVSRLPKINFMQDIIDF